MDVKTYQRIAISKRDLLKLLNIANIDTAQIYYSCALDALIIESEKNDTTST